MYLRFVHPVNVTLVGIVLANAISSILDNDGGNTASYSLLQFAKAP